MRVLEPLVGILLIVAPAPAQERWTLERVSRVGSENEPGQTLTRVGQVVIAEDGRFFVSQPMDQSVLAFDAAGRRHATIGRQGRGPGEFQGLGWIGLLRDTLYVADVQLRRISFFSLDGSLLSSVPWQSQALAEATGPLVHFGPTVPQLLLADGTALVAPGAPVMLIENGTITRTPRLRIDRTGAILDTLLWTGFPPRAVPVMHNGNRFFARPAFIDTPLDVMRKDGSGLVVIERRAASHARPSSFRMIGVDVSGDTVWTRDHAYRPIPVPAAVVAETIAQNIETERRRGDPPGPREFERALRNADLVPAMLPPVTEAVGASDGTLWLRRERTAEPQHGWSIFDRSGAAIGSVSLPAAVAVRDARNSTVVGVETDALGVQYILVYRIERRSP
ncbi:MAG: 6-bladed beta-propeller [Gemmatimonadetes bacterium]|nr:6-bladed beta-propeller [Gemmatimonadota bacterium]